MSRSRGQDLLARERDGLLSAVEREELLRLSRADPALRRERAGWERVERALGEACGRASTFEVGTLANRVARRVGERSAPPARRPRWQAVMAAAAVAALFGLIGLHSERAPERPAPAPRLVRAQPKVRPLVEVESIRAEGADEDLALIRF